MSKMTFQEQGLFESSCPSLESSTGSPFTSSRVMEQSRRGAYPMSGAIISDCPSNVTVSDCIKARVVLRRRWNINESELSEIDTWPAREKEDEKSGSPYNSKEFENGMISIDTGISVVIERRTSLYRIQHSVTRTHA